MKKITFFLLTLFSISTFSQRKYAKEFSFINDNDLYISTFQDRYYTNGMFLSYRYLSQKTNDKLAKKSYEIQVAHKMYTPFKATVELHGDHDRPFAAYLYGGFGINYFFKNNSILKASGQLGIIGPSALGQNLQDFIHDIYNFKKAIGWKYQITNALGLNLNIDYTKHLFKDNSNYIDISWNSNAKAGTVFTEISSGFYARIGLTPLQEIINSIAFNGNLNNNQTNLNNEIETFLFFKPMINYTVYDATIQGSFLNSSSPITYELKPLRFTTQIGILFTANKFNLGYIVNYHSKKLKSFKVPTGNFYGTFQINYQFN